MDQINSTILRQFEQQGLNINEGVAIDARLVRSASRPVSNEKLEQLRLLENGIPIQVVVTEHTSFGVDHPEDLEPVARLLAGEKANERDQRQ